MVLTREALQITPSAYAVFHRALRALQEEGVPFTVGGGVALYFHVGVSRPLKDLDLFVTPRHVAPALQTLQRAGFSTTLKHPEWLGQALLDGHQTDVIFGLGNWLASVDELWLARSEPRVFLDLSVRLAPPEEMIWSKAFICARERYDAADVFHYLLRLGHRIDWGHLLRRFGEHWEVLLSHLIMFRYIYPADVDRVPGWVLDDLLQRLAEERRRPWRGPRLCRGPLLDGIGSYAVDVTTWGYVDARREARQQLVRRLRSTPGFPVQAVDPTPDAGGL